MIEWTDKLSVGNEAIDNDHKHLIKLINAYARVVGNKNYDLLGPAFDSLEEYANEHFIREETLMEAVHYPHRASHRDAHNELLKSVREMHQQIDEHKNVHVDELSAFLHDWLIEHVVKEDMQLKPYVTGGRHDKLTPQL